jgi:phosphatidylethanolamine/phosphatidyl-N-methylethanolamine N-methyltransferase
MALFERDKARTDDDLVVSADAATRVLSVAGVDNDVVEGIYDRLARVYDVVWGPLLHPGRLRAIERMAIAPGDRVLEVGVGTGINIGLYPRDCNVVGIDFSASMLEKARERRLRLDLPHVRLLQMDAADLRFGAGSFDIVYAPYLISVVPDPLSVAREMRRVCRPGGRLIFLNHFLSDRRLVRRLERLISPLTVHVGFKADLDLGAFLTQAGLRATSIEKVNVAGAWSLVTCVNE